MSNNSAKNPFRVPENYFNDLNASVWERINKNERPNNFKVPQGYFNALEATVLKNTKRHSYKREKTLIAYLGSIVAMLFVIISINSPEVARTDGENMIGNYLETFQLYEMDSYEMASYFESDGLSFSEMVTFPEGNDEATLEMTNYFDYTDFSNIATDEILTEGFEP